MKHLQEARRLLLSGGWLSQQPPPFQQQLLAGAHLQSYAPGQVIFRLGDRPGGLYGLASGAVCVKVAPPHEEPKLLHIGTPGNWFGEGCFLGRQPRRITVSALGRARVLYVPLPYLDQISEADPQVFRHISQLLMISVDILIQAYYEQHEPSERLRLAATLLRLPYRDGTPIPISQSDLGMLSKVSRKMVNIILGEFAAQGWIAKAYRSVVVLRRAELESLVARRHD